MWRGWCVLRVWRACLVLHRFQLAVHDVQLRVRNGEDVAVCVFRAGSCSFDFELHAVLCINQPLAVAVQGGVGHGPQVDPETELVASEILGQVHVGTTAIGCVRAPCACMPSRVEVTGELIPHVSATNLLVVDPVGDPVDCDLHFGDVGVEIVLGVPAARHEGVDEQQENALERPALWVHPKVNPGVAAPYNGDHPFAHDEVIGELLAAGVCAGGLVGQTLAPNRLVLQLDVFQLVHELACVRASDHLVCGSEG